MSKIPKVSNRLILMFSLTSAVLISSCKDMPNDKHQKSTQNTKHYEADWDALSNYEEAPEWFRNAKFGIYAHWGVLSVPAYANDWYARNMHLKGTDEYRHHVETYGPPSDFGYHDFVPMFNAEHFDADRWAQLFKNSGAQFAGIVAEHHDGWSNWNSKINPWNSVDKGPKIDILGKLEKAICQRDMKFITSFHKARNLQIYQDDTAKWTVDTSYFPYNPEMPTSSTQPELAQMYGNIPKEKFYCNWLGELKEVIDQYHPDLIYFDSQLQKIPNHYKREFAAHYLNESEKRHQPVVITHKEGELPKTVSIEDLEKGRMNKMTKAYWLTDETLSTGSWSYVEGMSLKTADHIIDILADIVSKNGALMLNVSPRADGIIPQDQRKVLDTIGNWLTVNGEAIYGSRTWKQFGEGPTKQKQSGMFLDKINYTAQDIRYTQKGKAIYAIFLGWPEQVNQVDLSAFSGFEGKVKSIVTLAGRKELDFTMDTMGLHINLPSTPIDPKAFVLKIMLK